MADMITPNFSRAEMSCRCGCGLDHMDEKFMKMLQQLRNQLGPLPVASGVRCEKHNHESGGYLKSAHLQSKEQISGSLDLVPYSWFKKQGGSDFLELLSTRKAINHPGSFTWIYYPELHYGVIEPPWTGRIVSPSEGLLSPIHLSNEVGK